MDDVFHAKRIHSFPTIRRKREQSIKEIKLVVAYRLNLPLDVVLIESPAVMDKRIKMIKINRDFVGGNESLLLSATSN